MIAHRLLLLLALVACVPTPGVTYAQAPGANVYFLPQWPQDSLGHVLMLAQDIVPGKGSLFWPERLPPEVRLDTLRTVAALRLLPPDEAAGFLQIPFIFLPKLLPELEERAILYKQRVQMRQTWQVAPTDVGGRVIP